MISVGMLSVVMLIVVAPSMPPMSKKVKKSVFQKSFILWQNLVFRKQGEKALTITIENVYYFLFQVVPNYCTSVFLCAVKM
jgi:hypothetical protein